jgi:anthranilate synthase component 2
MIVIVDNKDSFVWNIAEYVSYFDRVKVIPSSTPLGEIKKLNPDGVIISPGPGEPFGKDSGNSPEVAAEFQPLLGICLGHQIVAEVYGGEVGRVKPVHGKQSRIFHRKKGVFRDLPNPFLAGRYHSLAIKRVPKGFSITSVSDDGVVMSIESRKLDVIGLQFHPESVLTPHGMRIISNWVREYVGKDLRNKKH